MVLPKLHNTMLARGGLLSLQHLDAAVQGGVPKKYWDSLRREVLHTYGHEHILTLTSLQNAGQQLDGFLHL